MYFGWGHNPKLCSSSVSCGGKIQPARPPTDAKASCWLTVSCSSVRGLFPPHTSLLHSTPRNWLEQEGLPCLEQLIRTSCSCPTTSKWLPWLLQALGKTPPARKQWQKEVFHDKRVVAWCTPSNAPLRTLLTAKFSWP